MSESDLDRLTRERDDARAEVAALRNALDKIQREASRRFEGKNCERCYLVEAWATAALQTPLASCVPGIIPGESDTTAKFTALQELSVQSEMSKKKK